MLVIICSCCVGQVSLRTEELLTSVYLFIYLLNGFLLSTIKPQCARFHSSDVMDDAKKLIGAGKKHLVMGDVVSAVNVLQDACRVL